jgi:hypothetical protein
LEVAVSTELIVRELRGGRSPDRLISQEAGSLVEKIVTRSGPAGYREVIVSYLTRLFGEVSAALTLEHKRRVTLGLDAAEARSHWTVLARLLTVLSKDPSVPEQVRDRIITALVEHAEPPEQQQERV